LGSKSAGNFTRFGRFQAGASQTHWRMHDDVITLIKQPGRPFNFDIPSLARAVYTHCDPIFPIYAIFIL
jgi:hypothetical protein